MDDQFEGIGGKGKGKSATAEVNNAIMDLLLKTRKEILQLQERHLGYKIIAPTGSYIFTFKKKLPI